MLQQEKPEDYVIGTEEVHSVGEFIEEAFNYVRLDWRKYVKLAPHYFRPLETELLTADASKMKDKLSWQLKNNSRT